ncbi:ShlB/FhaC/HecB family hemolysin secretion/activation protein [Marinicellulosiphila megalodicopiae]|uniref:ShlB/FhaC/HecB family hemolysin secretion/activation protein n=1 Tax=Marinicellulosiphila megalodicopiae TaxID=2724896 RepID=UPI003BB0EFEE
MSVNGFLIEGYTDQSELQSEKHKTAVNEIINIDMQKNKSGYNIDLLRDLTDQITNYYRLQGYFLASSYIPQQTADDGYIVIKIVEGTLASVNPEGNKVFKNELLQTAFAQYIGKPVSKDQIETAVLLVNDYPGYNGTAIFSPGNKIGETVLILKTQEDVKTKTVIGFDNYGSPTTGQYRFRGDIYINNLSAAADQLTINGIYSIDPANNLSLSTNYNRPIINPNINLIANYNYNSYVIGGNFEDLGINGNSHILSSTLNYKHLRTTPKNINYNTSLAYKYSESYGLGQPLFSNSFVLSLGANISGQSPFLNGRYFAQTNLSKGLLSNLTNTRDDSYNETFLKLNASGSYSFPVPNLANQYALIRSNFQYTSDTLHSSERLALAGNQSLRAVPISEYSVDSGIILNLEWIAKSKPTTEFGWLKNIQATGFIDNAYGAINATETGSQKALTSTGNTTFQSSIGVGIHLTPSNKFQLKSTLGYRPTKIETANASEFLFLTNLSYQF